MEIRLGKDLHSADWRRSEGSTERTGNREKLTLPKHTEKATDFRPPKASAFSTRQDSNRPCTPHGSRGTGKLQLGPLSGETVEIQVCRNHTGDF